MSKRRTTPTGWCNERTMPRGPNGRALCRQCGTEVQGRRRTFCSDACVREWCIRRSPARARRYVFDRDHGICRLCGCDTVALGLRWEADHIVPVVEGGGECGLEGYRTLCLHCHKRETAKLARRRAAARKQTPGQ